MGPDLDGAGAGLALFRRLADSVPGMLAYWDREQRCRFANRAYEAWFGVSPEALIGTHIRDLLGPIYALNQPYIEAVLRGEPQVFDRAIPDPAGGGARQSQTHYTPDIVDGVVQGFVVLVADITARKLLEEQLRAEKAKSDQLATHDYLTGLPNRLLLEDRVQRALEHARRERQRCALLILDLDAFKEVNDQYGHLIGDDVLCAVAVRLLEVLRRSDTVARIGGDEFVVLVPVIERSEDAEAVAHTLLSAFAAMPVEASGRAFQVALSVGIALFPDDGSDARALFASADQALYRVKRDGKGKYALANAAGYTNEVRGLRELKPLAINEAMPVTQQS